MVKSYKVLIYVFVGFFVFLIAQNTYAGHGGAHSSGFSYILVANRGSSSLGQAWVEIGMTYEVTVRVGRDLFSNPHGRKVILTSNRDATDKIEVISDISDPIEADAKFKFSSNAVGQSVLIASSEGKELGRVSVDVYSKRNPGVLIKAESSNAIELLISESGATKKLVIPDTDSLFFLGYTFSDVVTVPLLEEQGYPFSDFKLEFKKAPILARVISLKELVNVQPPGIKKAVIRAERVDSKSENSSVNTGAEIEVLLTGDSFKFPDHLNPYNIKVNDVIRPILFEVRLPGDTKSRFGIKNTYRISEGALSEPSKPVLTESSKPAIIRNDLKPIEQKPSFFSRILKFILNFLGLRRASPVISPAPPVTITPTPPLVAPGIFNWKIYRNERYNLELKYPDNWEEIPIPFNNYGEYDIVAAFDAKQNKDKPCFGYGCRLPDVVVTRKAITQEQFIDDLGNLWVKLPESIKMDQNELTRIFIYDPIKEENTQQYTTLEKDGALFILEINSPRNRVISENIPFISEQILSTLQLTP